MMKIKFAKRMDSFQEGIFNTLDDRKNELLAAGRTVYNLSIGTPDFKPEQHIMDAVAEAAKDPANYKYSMVNLPELTLAVQNWYKRRYDVELTEDEIMSVNGSQEGFAHIALPLLDQGDVILCPNPGYPIFEIGPWLCGAKIVYYDLLPENDYLPDLNSIPANARAAAKAMIVSYPANPIGKCAPRSFYEALVDFAKENNIIIIHDNAYSDIIYDGREGISFLSIPGAIDVGIEFNSLSKTYNMTGARISFVLGNAKLIAAFKKVRSQIDYGIFLPVQYGAIAALNGPQEGVTKQKAEYERRRDALCKGLRRIGWDVPDAEGSMFVWAKVPKGHGKSTDFVLELMDKAGVVCTPGSAFGPLGEGYVRFAMVLPAETIMEMVEAIDESGILNKENV